MEKDFDTWNEKKKNIHHANVSPLYFKEREVWWCSLGVNIGFEQDGKGRFFQRPVVILRKFNLDTCLIVPLSTQIRSGKYHFNLDLVAGRHATALLSQMRMIDRRRLVDKKMDLLSEKVFSDLIQAIIAVNFGP